MSGDPSPYSVALRGVDRYLRGLVNFFSTLFLPRLSSLRQGLFHRTRPCAFQSIAPASLDLTSCHHQYLSWIFPLFTCVVFSPFSHTKRAPPSGSSKPPAPKVCLVRVQGEWALLGCRFTHRAFMHVVGCVEGQGLEGTHTRSGGYILAHALMPWPNGIGQRRLLARATRPTTPAAALSRRCEFLLGILGAGR